MPLETAPPIDVTAIVTVSERHADIREVYRIHAPELARLGRFEAIVGRLAGVRFRDLSCGVRAVRREALARLPLAGDLHRFLPLVAHVSGLRVEEVPARQHPADTGRRLFSPGLYLQRAMDIGQ